MNLFEITVLQQCALQRVRKENRELMQAACAILWAAGGEIEVEATLGDRVPALEHLNFETVDDHEAQRLVLRLLDLRDGSICGQHPPRRLSTMSEPSGFPLAWPVGWKRTPADRRKAAPFSKKVDRGSGYTSSGDLTIADGLARVTDELRRLGVPNEQRIISTNVELRLDGLPRSDRGEPKDPGAAVYFRLRAGGKPKVFACDRWTRVSDNLAAIAGHINALRAVERYGVGEVEQVFAGYTALPPSAEDWRSVFGFGPDETPAFQKVDDRYQRLMKAAHPDRPGGDALQAARLNTARDMARVELGDRT